jgi:hypothetical protein
MVGDDQFQAGNRTARLAGLPGLLQGMGANRTTEVVIVVTPRCSPPAMAAIGGKLGAAGFRKVMFQKPRGATSYVGGRDTKERPK